MGKVSIAGSEFEVGVVSRGEQVTFRLVVEYETAGGDRVVERSTLAVDSRSELTTDAVSAALTEWADERDVAEVVGFAVVEEQPARRGGEPPNVGEAALLVDPSDRDTMSEQATEEAVARSSWYVEGDHLLYHEGGPDSTVYGYTTEGIVAEAPPIEHQHRENEPDKIRLDVGKRTKLVPLEWVIGHADETDEPIDKPRDL
ncbi:hypothetical protein [Halorientalis regularis]|jgi:hypothetical protein|uniref:Uncharacterized protein n=1 Tax=Halorientalis regularis TaxID=660518 RepID=A0A1G7PXX4_9EURY|nr:hypothetical protein [Halorientalis regularis]SDF91106.1 hypothetical protein SAMN05216218_11170 [Halorientalis regularis]